MTLSRLSVALRHGLIEAVIALVADELTAWSIKAMRHISPT
jgi:hypothetical protein